MLVSVLVNSVALREHMSLVTRKGKKKRGGKKKISSKNDKWLNYLLLTA